MVAEKKEEFDPHAMRMHQLAVVTTDLFHELKVRRVPGGWVYTEYLYAIGQGPLGPGQKVRIGCMAATSTFVPEKAESLREGKG